MEEFDILEEKIEKLIAEFKKLKSQEGDASGLKEENERLKEERKLIKGKIERIISKLDEI
ncbi:MAG: hypothetical protein AB1595_02935 [bacterium]